MPDVCRIARDEVGDLRNEGGSRPFVPLDELRSYFKEQKIREILECTCTQCQDDLRMFKSRREPGTYVDRIMGKSEPNDPRKAFYSVFGLLVHVEHPLFIIGFLDQRCNDYSLEYLAAHAIFPQEYLEAYTGDYRRDPIRYRRFATKFFDNLPTFAIPHFESADFSQYGERVVMPFVKEVEIGKKMTEDGRLTSEGANGTVFAFQIHQEYNFPGASSEAEYVRKRIETTEPQALLESSNIQHVQRFKHKHIVKLTKAYGHGQSINLIFPRAWTNLDHLLRNPSFGRKRSARLYTDDAWDQLLGIAGALKQMHEYGDETGGAGVRTLIHFDLKPDNILVQRDGTWLITDFGQAALTARRRGTSNTPRVGGHFGTDAYAPPEIDSAPQVTFGRAYDIWSLGCIMLEVTAFVVHGKAGLTGTSELLGLDQARKSRSVWARNDDERFFCKGERDGDYVVKREIRAFMENLNGNHGSEDSDAASMMFLSTIIGLIEGMLKPKATDRTGISRVVDTLSSALARARADQSERREHAVRISHDEIVRGGPEVKKIQLWHSSAANDIMERSNLEILENHTGYLRLHCWAQGHEPSNVSVRRSDAKIVPLYAFSDPEKIQNRRTWIDFLFLSAGHPSEVPTSKYAFDGSSGLKQARLIQSIVTSQNIVASFDLSNLKLHKPISHRRVLRGLLHRTRVDGTNQFVQLGEGSSELGSATVQIWIEQKNDIQAELSRRTSLGPQTSTAARSGRRHDRDQQKVLPCRVCIYVHKQQFVCTIKIDVNWVVEESKSDDKVLLLKPLSSRSNRTLYASWLRPTPEEFNAEPSYPAGIPLDPKVLQYYEDLDCDEVQSLELTFHNADDREMFWGKYQMTKRDWDRERQDVGDLFEVNRMPEGKPRVPDGVTHLPVPAKKVPFSASASVDKIPQSVLRTSMTRSRHDSTVEHNMVPPQDRNHLSVTMPR